jgi:hypothetical protein
MDNKIPENWLNAVIRIQQEAQGFRIWSGMNWKWQHYRAKRIHEICTKLLREVYGQ